MELNFNERPSLEYFPNNKFGKIAYKYWDSKITIKKLKMLEIDSNEIREFIIGLKLRNVLKKKIKQLKYSAVFYYGTEKDKNKIKYKKIFNDKMLKSIYEELLEKDIDVLEGLKTIINSEDTDVRTKARIYLNLLEYLYNKKSTVELANKNEKPIKIINEIIYRDESIQDMYGNNVTDKKETKPIEEDVLTDKKEI